MPKRNLPAPATRSSGLLAPFKGNRTAKQIAAINEQAFVQRVYDGTRRDLKLLEMTDIEALAVRGIAAAGNVAGHAVAEVAANPYAAKAIDRLNNTAASGLNGALRDYIDGN